MYPSVPTWSLSDDIFMGNKLRAFWLIHRTESSGGSKKPGNKKFRTSGEIVEQLSEPLRARAIHRCLFGVCPTKSS